MENRYTAPLPASLLSLLGVSCVCASVGFSRHIQSELLDELDSIRLLQLWQNDLFSSVSSHTLHPMLGNGVAHDENTCALLLTALYQHH